MRSSTTEVLKLFLPTSEHDAYDQKRLRADQRRIRVKSQAMTKFLRAQIVMADWLFIEFEEGASASRLMAFSMSPPKLYKQLQKIGYVWDNGFWRLRKGRSAPKGANHA